MVITTFLTPAVFVGMMQVMLVLEITFGEAHVVPPIVTVAPEINPVPKSERVEPPAKMPLAGLIDEIVGIGLYV